MGLLHRFHVTAVVSPRRAFGPTMVHGAWGLRAPWRWVLGDRWVEASYSVGAVTGWATRLDRRGAPAPRDEAADVRGAAQAWPRRRAVRNL